MNWKVSTIMKGFDRIRDVSFDDHANIIGITTPNGFQIVDSNSGIVQNLCNLTNIEHHRQGCSLISTLGTSNIIAVTPLEEDNKTVCIWDRFNNTFMSEISYDANVVSVALKPEYIIAATIKTIQIRKLSDSTLIRKFDTTFNRDGIFAYPSLFASNIIAYPAVDTGVVTIVDAGDISFSPKYIHAFKSSILSLKFNHNGRLLAVCGDEGRTIHIYNYPSLKLVARLKRNTTSTHINSISFDEHGTLLAVSDSSESIQIFDLHQESEEDFIKPMYKLKSPDSQSVWLNFSSKTLKLTCISYQGNIYRISLNREEKTANFQQIGTKLKIK